MGSLVPLSKESLITYFSGGTGSNMGGQLDQLCMVSLPWILLHYSCALHSSPPEHHICHLGTLWGKREG